MNKERVYKKDKANSFVRIKVNVVFYSDTKIPGSE